MSATDIRPYRHEDRAAVRRICADTGFLGHPIDPVFEDRELFADYLTNYYLHREPESTLVCEIDGVVGGYLLGCRRPLAHQAYQALANAPIAARALWRSFARPYTPSSREFIRWIACHAWREIPAAPRFVPHFHINLLAGVRSVRHTRLLIQSFLGLLHAAGHRQVCGQMVTYETRRTSALFERYGFRILHRAEISKYRRAFAGRVFLSTLIKDLSAGPALATLSHRTPEEGAHRPR